MTNLGPHIWLEFSKIEHSYLKILIFWLVDLTEKLQERLSYSGFDRPLLSTTFRSYKKRNASKLCSSDCSVEEKTHSRTHRCCAPTLFIAQLCASFQGKNVLEHQGVTAN